MESDKPPHDKEKDSLPILPQTAVRQTTDFTMPMHMSFTDEDLEESTSSSSEDGSLSPNQSGFLPNIANAIASLKTEGGNGDEIEGEEEELEEELEEEIKEESEGELEEELEEKLEEDEGVEEGEKKEKVPTFSSVNDVGRERFSTALVVTRNIQHQQNRVFSECARASARQVLLNTTLQYYGIFLDFRISVLVRDQYGLMMLANTAQSSIGVKLVQDKRELQEIHESMLEIKSDPHRSSKLLSTYSNRGRDARDGEVMAIFGEVSELDDLLGEFPVL